MSFIKSHLHYMNPYDIHKAIINEYILKKPGDTKLLKRDSSRDKTDVDVLKEHHKFLWDDNEPITWEQEFAKKYYDKLFKEYCIADLSQYKENKIALRWRTEQEVIVARGQFSCGNKKCNEKVDLRTWEVNFGYVEQGEKKNALVKIKLCQDCSIKLNYHSKKKEVKRVKHKNKYKSNKSTRNANQDNASTSTASLLVDKTSAASCLVDDNKLGNQSIVNEDGQMDKSHWSNLKPPETKTRDEEMEEYLQDLLL